MSDQFWERLYASRPRRDEHEPRHHCPRRGESLRATASAVDTYGPDDSCSYCGSLDPNAFMARCEAGDVELTPTDKSYKVYARNVGGEAFKQMYRPSGSPQGDDPRRWEWVTHERDETKFYFQHLSAEQRTRFVALLNENRLRLAYPGRFYVLPFFITASKPISDATGFIGEEGG